MATRTILKVWLLAVALAATGCGSSGGDGDDPPQAPENPSPDPGPGSGSNPAETFSVGGAVIGMTGSGLVIALNGGGELTIDTPGEFTFGDELDEGQDYNVTIVSQPSAPDNVCTLDNGSGSIDGADVSDVEILCTGPLALTLAAPSDDDEDVSRAVEPLLTFSAGIDAATIVAGAITLKSDSGEVELAFDVSGTQVTLTPDGLLLPLTEYTLTVSTDVAGSDGERMLDPVTVTFVTRDAIWHADIEIDAAAGSANDAQVAFDADGNALALWYQENANGTDIWWNRFMNGVGWGTADRIEQNAAGQYAGSPRVGFEPGGNAVAVWTLYDSASGETSVRGSRYLAGADWTMPAFIENEPGNVHGTVEMAVNAEGDAVAVWVQFDGTFMNVWTNRYSVAGGWKTAEIVDESDDVVESPRVAINGAGDALVVWPMRDLNNFAWDVWARRYVAGDGWRPSKLLSVNAMFEAIQPRPVLDDDGNGLVVWLQGLGLTDAIHASRASDADDWSAPLELSVSGSMDEPALTLDTFGNAIAVWRQQENVNGSLEMVPFAARFTPSDGWNAPEAIGNRTVLYPKVAFDATGNAIAAWVDIDLSLPIPDAFSVRGNRFTVANGWTAAERIGSNGGLIGTNMPGIAVDPSGDAFAIWTRGGEVRVNRFE